MSSVSKTARQVFLEAIEAHAPEEWPAFLDQACEGDSQLRQRVGVLLEAHVEGGSLLDNPAVAPAATLDQPLLERPGTQIGPYKLLQQIGEGGFGVVFMAEQLEPVRRKVALKVIKPGMDTRQVIARFDAERQALAVMDHPNIARVLDAGATEFGRPYFVMELVRGIPITQYCDENNLPVRDRLTLFASVCRAIQHAHTKGIIHRDIKPTNVMVTRQDGQSMVKVIDFGVAKAMGQQLTDKTLFTDFAQMIGTPLYMSPEQAELSSNDIDTRSDIYSLGVLLYELLTGSTPVKKEQFKQAAIDEIRRIIREDEPQKPSTRISTAEAAPSIAAQRQTEPAKLTALVRGELDWIVMKALEKDRSRRYETASGLVADVQRYLNDETVQACPPSVWYRFRKFARRNKRVLAMVVVVALAILIAAGTFGWSVRDRAARQIATEQEVGLAIKEAEGLLHQGRYAEAQSVARRAEGILSGGSEDLRARVRELQRDAQMAIRLDAIRITGGDTAGAIERDGQYAQAFREYGLDVESLDPQQVAGQVAARTIRPELIVALDNWAHERKGTGKSPEANWKRLIAIARAADPDEWRNQVRNALEQGQVEVLRNLAASPKIRTLPVQTLDLLGTALHHAGSELDLPILRAAQRRFPGDFSINFKLAWALDHRSRPEVDEAIRFYTVALALRPQNLAVLRILGAKLMQKGELDEAIACYKKVNELDSKNAGAQILLGNALNSHGKVDEAIACYKKAIELDPKNADAHIILGNVLNAQGKVEEVIAHFKKAIDLDPKNADAHSNLGFALNGQGKVDEAITCYKRSIELDPKSARSHVYLANVLTEQGKHDEAIACYEKALELDPMKVDVLIPLGIALTRQGKVEEAIAYYKRAIEGDPKNAVIHNCLGTFLAGQGKYDQAIDYYKEAIEVDSKNAEAHELLAGALRAQKKFDEAVVEYQKSIKLDPTNAWRQIGLGDFLAMQGKYDEAIPCYKRAIELDPKSPWTHFYFANFLVAQKKFDEAVVWYRTATELDPTNAALRAALGSALTKQGKVDEAIICYKKALEFGPKNAALHNQLAWHLATCADAKLRDPIQAVAIAKKAVQLDPMNADIAKTLGAAYYRAGDWKAAIASIAKSVELRQGDDASAWFFLAMAHWQLREKEEANKWYDQAVQWMDQHAPGSDAEQRRFRGEAADLLGVKEKKN